MQGKTVAPIFEYRSLFNVDLAIYDIIKYGFGGSKFFVDGILDLSSLEMIYVFQERENPNPLTSLLKEEYLDSADSLLEDIMEKYKDIVYFNIYYTDLYRLFHNLLLIEGRSVSVSIIVDDQYQEAMLRSIDLPIAEKLKIYRRRDGIDLELYDAIYIDNLYKLREYNPKVVGKHIFTLRNGINTVYDYTTEKYIIKDEFHEEFPNNLFYVTEPYDKLAKIAR